MTQGRPDEPRFPLPTRYLPAERTAPALLAAEIAAAARSPVVEALLVSSGAALAVLDEARQIVALNAAWLALLGCDDPQGALGLRPGEAVGCVHARETAGGCGTSEACASCGAAIAILAASGHARACERDCSLRIERDGRISDHVFRARAAPLVLDEGRFVLLTLADVTPDRRRAALQRAFVHELANVATALQSAAGVLDDPREAADAAAELRTMAERLVREIRLQRALAGAEGLRAALAPVALGPALERLRATLLRHPAAAGRSLRVAAGGAGGPTVLTDAFLLEHVLACMVLNALEATPQGGEVRIEVEDAPDAIALRVWNAGAIPAAVRPRIFQRFFTTKAGEGRGQGTFAMRLLGESWLGAQVGFTTSEADGTSFRIALPRHALPLPAPPG